MKRMPVEGSEGGLQETGQRHHTPRNQLHKAGVTHPVRKGAPPMGQDLAGLEVLKGPETRAVKGNDDCHHFTQAQTRTIGLGLAIVRQRQRLITGRFNSDVAVIHIAEDLSQVEAR